MQPLTAAIPKPMIPVAGVPIIERLVRQFIQAGVDEIFIITGWLGDQIERHFEKTPEIGARARLQFVRETEPLGNFGGIALLPGCKATTLFAFGDLVTDIRFEVLLERHWEGGADATLASHDEAYQVTLGELIVDGSAVKAYHEKLVKRFTICSGMLAFEPRVLAALDAGRPVGISDFITAALTAGFTINHWPHGMHFLDVNRPDLVEAANSAPWCLSSDFGHDS
jgi:NDP-sugar pyrophosphorylase family protein